MPGNRPAGTGPASSDVPGSVTRQNATLDRGLDILDLFLDSSDPLTIADISEKLGIPQSSVYRIVRSMRDRQWLSVSPPGEYRMGNRLLTAVSRAESQSPLINAAGPILEALTAQTRETSLLTVISGLNVVCLVRVEGPQAIRVSFQPGAVLPLHAGASSTALLAFADPALVDRICGNDLIRYSPKTVTAPGRLRARLAAIRTAGYAHSEGEIDGGVVAVAAPALTARDRPAIAAISVVAPSLRLADDQVAGTAQLVVAAAQALSRAMTGDPPHSP